MLIAVRRNPIFPLVLITTQHKHMIVRHVYQSTVGDLELEFSAVKLDR